jgi:acetylornithine deacetylase
MLTKYLDLLVSLLKIDSSTPHERDAMLFLYRFLSEQFEYDTLDLQVVAPNRSNLLLLKGHPRTTLTSHIDTVPGHLKVVENDTEIYGRGACDAKGQIATQLYALEKAIMGGLQDFACFFVVGEEIDSIGALTVVKDPRIGSRYLVNGEPTGNQFVKLTRGILEFGLTATGTAKHSSLVPLDSAIHKIVGDLSRILSIADAHCSINVGRITGGIVSNMSADYARADCSARFEASFQEVTARIGDCLKESKLVINSEPIDPFELYVPEEHRATAPVVSFSTDAALYADKFERIILFGPGSIEYAHSEDEHIQKNDIVAAGEILSSLLLRW